MRASAGEQLPEWHFSSAGRSLVTESELKEWEEMQMKHSIADGVVSGAEGRGEGKEKGNEGRKGIFHVRKVLKGTWTKCN